MDRLWAPWRTQYINASKRKKRCIFCTAARDNRPSSQVVFKTKLSVVMLNIFPYNNGHLLVSPLRHIPDIDQLTEDETQDLFAALKEAKRLLQRVLKPAGFNIGINISRYAGAGIEDHLHIHIVPRWLGDTNFMPVVHNTKIISESLQELLKRLKNARSKTNK